MHNHSQSLGIISLFSIINNQWQYHNFSKFNFTCHHFMLFFILFQILQTKDCFWNNIFSTHRIMIIKTGYIFQYLINKINETMPNFLKNYFRIWFEEIYLVSVTHDDTYKTVVLWWIPGQHVTSHSFQT